MIKKLSEFTSSEVKKICEKYCSICGKCPLSFKFYYERKLRNACTIKAFEDGDMEDLEIEVNNE